APVMLLVGWFALHGGLGAFVTAMGPGTVRAVSFIDARMPTLWAVAMHVVPLVGVALALGRIRSRRRRFAFAIAGAVGAALVAMQWTHGYLALWYGTLALVPLGVITVARTEWRPQYDSPRALPIVLLGTAVPLLALNQLPYPSPNYFAYVAPLALLLV